MRLLDLTLPSPEANLALDEALLNSAEAGQDTSNVLRIWEARAPFVVLGRASKRREEVNLEACRAAGVPVLRRCSGGTAVVAGPGCLMYAVLLGYQQHPELRVVDQAHQFVMTRMQRALSRLSPAVEFRGSCDLTLGEAKISGNSLRCKRHHLLYHGTVLYDFPLRQIADWLKSPPRQPDYRQGRPHAAFVTNFPFPAKAIRDAIASAWMVSGELEAWPQAATQELATGRYASRAWNERL